MRTYEVGLTEKMHIALAQAQPIIIHADRVITSQPSLSFGNEVNGVYCIIAEFAPGSWAYYRIVEEN